MKKILKITINFVHYSVNTDMKNFKAILLVCLSSVISKQIKSQNTDPSIPLIKSNWHQRASYNVECPTWTNHNKTITSLVRYGGNTLGQVLRYYSHPTTLTESVYYFAWSGGQGQLP